MTQTQHISSRNYLLHSDVCVSVKSQMYCLCDDLMLLLLLFFILYIRGYIAVISAINIIVYGMHYPTQMPRQSALPKCSCQIKHVQHCFFSSCWMSESSCLYISIISLLLSCCWIFTISPANTYTFNRIFLTYSTAHTLARSSANPLILPKNSVANCCKMHWHRQNVKYLSFPFPLDDYNMIC